MTNDIRELHCKNVSVSEDGEGCQVVFGDTEQGDVDYLLIQGHGRDSYIETTDVDYCGHFPIRRGELSRRSFRMTYGTSPVVEFRVTFEAPDATYAEMVRVFQILVRNLTVS